VGLGSGGGVGDDRFAVADGDVLAGERLELGGQVAMRPSVLQKTATGEIITWGSRIPILSSLPAETRPEGLAPGGCHAGRRRVA